MISYLPMEVVDFESFLNNNSQIKMCYPFGEFNGSESFFDKVYKPLLNALPDLERRDMIVMAGKTPEGKNWIGTMGNYMGTFLKPYLHIQPTGNLVHMRYHEFFQRSLSFSRERSTATNSFR